MTFTQIVTEVLERAGLSSPESTARIGRNVNTHYKRLTASVGVQVGRRVTGVTGATSMGSALVTFEGIEKIERVFDDHTGTTRWPDELTFDELRKIDKTASDTVSAYAVKKMDAQAVTIEVDVLAQTVFNLKADGLETATTLSGSQEPQIPESFHDILVEDALAIELRIMGHKDAANKAEQIAKDRTSELRYFIAKSGALKLRQGGAGSKLSGLAGGASGGSGVSGSTSYTQTGLITFDRDPAVPFAVTAGSAVVPNLDADTVDGLHATGVVAAARADIVPVDLASEVEGVLPTTNMDLATLMLLNQVFS